MTVLERRFLKAIEPLVTTCWMGHPESVQAYAAAGIDDPLAGYVTCRAAPLGHVGAATVASIFYNWDPRRIAATLRFDLTTPEQAVAARERGAEALLRRLLPGEGEASDIARAVELLRRATDAAPSEGHPLFAANAALAWPDQPLVALWHGANMLREHRGDAHNAILVAHGLDGVEALVLNVAYTGWSRRFFYGLRGWPEARYQAAHELLGARGFLDPEGRLTDAGMKFREMLELETDRAAARPFEALGTVDATELLRIIEPLGELVVQRGGVSPAVSRIGGR